LAIFTLLGSFFLGALVTALGRGIKEEVGLTLIKRKGKMRIHSKNIKEFY